MAAPQRLRVYSVLAMGLAAVNEFDEGLDWLDVAFVVAEQLDDASAMSTLLALRAAANNALFRHREAAEDYRDSRVLLHAQAVRGQPSDALSAVDLLTYEANMRFYMGEYHETEQLLDEARSLVPVGAGHGLEASTIHWIQAMLYRWHGEPERALSPAQTAARAYMQAGASASAVRIQTIVADIALDLSLTAIGSTQRALMLETATSHLDVALRLAEEVGDTNGHVLTRLIQLRASRLRGDNTGRVGLIEVLAREGCQLNDDTLLARAFTTLGDELVSQGEQESGLTCYRQVLGLLDGSEMPALAIWARRAYHQAREWQS